MELVLPTESVENLRLQIEQLKKRNQELEKQNGFLSKMAYVDPLTGLYNRQYFNKRLEQEWNRCRRSSSPISAVIIDIDHFKKYNDSYGHVEGDRLLKDLGNLWLKVRLRSSDVLARYGGEEFVLLLPHTVSIGAVEVAEMIREATTKVEALREVTLSMGVAQLTPVLNEEETPEQLIKNADEALYQAKEQGRNRIVKFS